jgi:hypothetical protein
MGMKIVLDKLPMVHGLQGLWMNAPDGLKTGYWHWRE